MDKMRMEPVNMTEKNIEKIEVLFPNVITETMGIDGNIKKVIKFELLKQVLSDDVVEGDEAYEFNWVGKKASIVEAGKPIRKTLRPCVEESAKWDSTENIYIEGDNLDVLKLLQESYLGMVKMIYIDPPYNTGSDLIYNDSFILDSQEYDNETSYFDEDGLRQFTKNEKTRPRFHSDWCSMIYPRLTMARNLLHEEGIIFISIDDNELSNLKKICDEVFGETNFISDIIWEKRFTRNNDAKLISSVLDHTLLYRKSPSCSMLREPRSEKANSIYKNPTNDPRGPWTSVSYVSQRTKEQRPNLSYGIKNPITKEVITHPVNAWKYSREMCEKHASEDRLFWGVDGKNSYPRLKRFLSELKDGMVPVNLWGYKEVGTLDNGTKEVDGMLGKDIFDYPKPKSLIEKMIKIANVKDGEIVMDFFSGSATTAHAVLSSNIEDGKKRKYILVQMPEACDEKSEAYKNGYKNICEIGKERIRKSGEKVNEDAGLLANDLDTGFRVFKLDSTNMKDVYYSAEEVSQSMLFDLESNIKEDRTDLDLLFGCLLEWGLPLSLPHKSEIIDGSTVHTINDGDLIACFSENISEDVIKEIAKRQPLRVVFRDSSFISSPDKINVEEIFKLMAPNTSIKVL